MEACLEIPVVRFASVLPAVEVRVGASRGTWLLDTGAGLTCLDAEVARREGIEGWGRLVGHRMGGERVELLRADGVALSIGSATLPPETVGIADLSAFVPPALGTLGGAVGLSSFAGSVLTVDLPTGCLRAETAETLEIRTAAADEVRVRIARSLGGLSLDCFVEIESPRGPLLFELDSGCTGPVIVAPHAAEALGLTDAGVGAEGALALPIGGTAPVDTPWVVRDVIYDGVIGLSVLDHRALTLDLPRSRAWLSRAPSG